MICVKHFVVRFDKVLADTTRKFAMPATYIWRYDSCRWHGDTYWDVNEMERDGRVSGNDYFANEINAVRARPTAAAAAAVVDGRRCKRRRADEDA